MSRRAHIRGDRLEISLHTLLENSQEVLVQGTTVMAGMVRLVRRSTRESGYIVRVRELLCILAEERTQISS